MSYLRPSKWNYQTGATGGVGIEFVVASGGLIVLHDPAGQEQDFHYGGVGVGLSAGLKIPKIKLPKFTIPEIKMPKIGGRSVGGAGSTKDFTSAGSVYMTSAFQGQELTRADFQGGTIYVDAGAGLIVGYAGSAMLLGMNASLLALGAGPGLAMAMAAGPAGLIWLVEQAIESAPAVLLMHGWTVGPQAAVGAGILAGYLH